MKAYRKSALGLLIIVTLVAPALALADSADTTDPLWTTPSASIDPTKLPLDNTAYTDHPQVGSLYPCDPNAYFNIPVGSSVTGSWVNSAANTWDITQKPYVHGSVSWPNAVFNITVGTSTRTLTGNGLPVGGTTGTYPVAKDDPAYPYDHNPNAVTAHEVNVALPLDPVVNQQPACVEPIIGYTLDGVAFEFALSSYEAHDEIAYEMQDSCGTMPDPVHVLHRHALSSCIPNITKRNALVGYAIDGFGIFSPYDANGKELTTADLDVCHGTTTPIVWDGKEVTMYHYVLTRDYPYTIGCFRGTPNYQNMGKPPTSLVLLMYLVRAQKFVTGGGWILMAVLVVLAGWGIYRRRTRRVKNF